MLLLITGAGASRNLGVDGPLPLMPDWATALCAALDEQEPNLAGACGLSPSMPAEEFEQALGLLLKWRQVHTLNRQFVGLGGQAPNSVTGDVQTWLAASESRMDRVVEAVNQTLYAEFGQKRIDDDRAREAYQRLLDALSPDGLAVATTNYDRAGEAALTQLGRTPVTGFDPRPGRTPQLDPRSIELRIALEEPKNVPYLHLHGAVGWYEHDGGVFDHYADQPFNPTLGTPVVLYPDPEKDPTNETTVSALWTLFEKLASEADAIVILGHSLHDPALVTAVQKALTPEKELLVVDWDDGAADRAIATFATEAKAVSGLQIKFGPGLEFSANDWVVIRGAVPASTGAPNPG